MTLDFFDLLSHFHAINPVTSTIKYVGGSLLFMHATEAGRKPDTLNFVHSLSLASCAFRNICFFALHWAVATTAFLKLSGCTRGQS